MSCVEWYIVSYECMHCAPTHVHVMSQYCNENAHYLGKEIVIQTMTCRKCLTFCGSLLLPLSHTICIEKKQQNITHSARYGTARHAMPCLCIAKILTISFKIVDIPFAAQSMIYFCPFFFTLMTFRRKGIYVGQVNNAPGHKSSRFEMCSMR